MHSAHGKYGTDTKGLNDEIDLAIRPKYLNAKSVVYQFCFVSPLSFFLGTGYLQELYRACSTNGLADWLWELCWWHCPHLADEKTEVLRNSVTCPTYWASKKACPPAKLMLFPPSTLTPSLSLLLLTWPLECLLDAPSFILPQGLCICSHAQKAILPTVVYTLTSSSTSLWFLHRGHSWPLYPNCFFPWPFPIPLPCFVFSYST